MSRAAVFDRVMNVLLVVAALSIAGTLVARRFDPPAQPSSPVALSLEQEWRALLDEGRTLDGPENPAIHLIEFVDLECPACRMFAPRLEQIRKRYERSLRVTLVHFPLPFHESALPAARIAECGVAEGKFDALVSRLLADGDSLDASRWERYAIDVGIRDRGQFGRCAVDTTTVERVVTGIAAADRIGVRATPTILVNGWRFSNTPTERELRETIDALLAQKTPPLATR